MRGLFIIDDQHGAAARRRCRILRALRDLCLHVRRDGRHRSPGRALAGCALGGDIAAQHAAVPGDGEAEPGAAVIPRGRGLRLRNAWNNRPSCSTVMRSGIGDAELHDIATVPDHPPGGDNLPCSVSLAALLNRLNRLWRSLVWSERIAPASSARSTTSVLAFLLISGSITDCT